MTQPNASDPLREATEQWVELFEAHHRGDDLTPIFERLRAALPRIGRPSPGGTPMTQPNASEPWLGPEYAEALADHLGQPNASEPLREAGRESLLRRGPFINEDGDIWVPATMGIAAARREAKGVAWGTAHFEGMDESVQMSLHEVGGGHPDEDEDGQPYPCDEPQPCQWEGRAYHFIDVEEP